MAVPYSHPAYGRSQRLLDEANLALPLGRLCDDTDLTSAISRAIRLAGAIIESAIAIETQAARVEAKIDAVDRAYRVEQEIAEAVQEAGR